MATQVPPRLAPAFTQPGQSAQRLAGTFFVPGTDTGFFPELNPQPKVIGNTTVNTQAFNVTGFNTFMFLVDVTGAAGTLQPKVNIISPLDQTTILQTRSLGAALGVGSGLTVIPFGFGNTAASGGVDVYIFISLGFTGNNAAVTLNQFPGLWGAVR